MTAGTGFGIVWNRNASTLDVYVDWSDPTWVWDPDNPDDPPPDGVLVNVALLGTESAMTQPLRGDKVTLVDDGRRVVSLPPMRSAFIEGPMLPANPYAAGVSWSAARAYWYGGVMTAAGLTSTLAYEAGDVLVCLGFPDTGATPLPDFMESVSSELKIGVALQDGTFGSIQTTTAVCIGVFTGTTKTGEYTTRAWSRDESSLLAQVDATSVTFSGLSGYAALSFVYGYSNPDNGVKVTGIKAVDADATEVLGSAIGWAGEATPPPNQTFFGELICASGGHGWIVNAGQESSLTLGTWDVFGNSGLLVPSSDFRCLVVLIPPIAPR